jgi:hypothetical protein
MLFFYVKNNMMFFFKAYYNIMVFSSKTDTHELFGKIWKKDGELLFLAVVGKSCEFVVSFSRFMYM